MTARVALSRKELRATGVAVRRVGQLGRVVAAHGVLPLVRPRVRRARPGPVRLRRALEELGGTWVKLGQALALRFDLLPAAYCYELFGLLNQVESVPFGEVERIIRAELGRGPGELFASFEREPFGAASIGQVHGAVLRGTGERVAVKVQRPGIRELIATDIALMYRLARLVDLTRVLGGTRTRDLIDEFARWTREELDYAIESANARTMRAGARDAATEHNPFVHAAYTTGRVLTAERLDGLLLVDVIRDLRADRASTTRRLRDAGFDIDQAAVNIVWNFLSQVYAVGVFHGDLHPANLLLLEGNRIGYVDFGIIGRLSEEVRQSLVGYAGNLFLGEVDAAIAEFLRWIKPSTRTDVGAATREMVALTHRVLFALEHADSDRRKLMAQYQVDMLAVTRSHRMAIDPVVVLYMKVVLTLDAVTTELSPSLDLRTLHVRFFRELILQGIAEASEPRADADAGADAGSDPDAEPQAASREPAGIEARADRADADDPDTLREPVALRAEAAPGDAVART